MRNPGSKIISLESALFWRAGLRRNGNTLVVTNGCFDILHAGHLQALCTAAAMGDALLVLLNSDASVQALKGPTRPIIPEHDRALLLAGLSCVSCVVLFEGERCDQELTALRPDVYCKSKEYQGRLDPAEEAALHACEANIVFIPVADGISTSKIIQKIQAGGGIPPPPAPPADCRLAGSHDAIAASWLAATAPLVNVPVAPREGVSGETPSSVAHDSALPLIVAPAAGVVQTASLHAAAGGDQGQGSTPILNPAGAAILVPAEVFA